MFQMQLEISQITVYKHPMQLEITVFICPCVAGNPSVFAVYSISVVCNLLCLGAGNLLHFLYAALCSDALDTP